MTSLEVAVLRMPSQQGVQHFRAASKARGFQTLDNLPWPDQAAVGSKIEDAQRSGDGESHDPRHGYTIAIDDRQ